MLGSVYNRLLLKHVSSLNEPSVRFESMNGSDRPTDCTVSSGPCVDQACHPMSTHCNQGF